MPTEKLYYTEPMCRTFTAAVRSCEPGERGWLVTLDRTAFYPEGGGQGADHGTLGGVAVTDVHERAGEVVHTCAAALPVGETVTGELDWERRFDNMQAHSGEHIVSGLIHALYGFDNVGFHMGADRVTIDFSGVLTWEQLTDIEARANRVVWADAPVEILWPTAEELAGMEYRSKKELSGAVRIVRFPGADTCACCGTHVVRAGQIGLIKLLSVQNFRAGVRVEMLCGRRALELLNSAWEQDRLVAQALSVKAEGTFEAVSRLKEELAQVKLRLAGLEEAAFAQRAEGLRGQGDVLLFEEGLSPDGVRRLADAVAAVCGGRAAVFAGADGEYKYAIGCRGGDLRAFTKEMNAALNGRGGGKPDFVQGGVRARREEIEAYFQR